MKRYFFFFLVLSFLFVAQEVPVSAQNHEQFDAWRMVGDANEAIEDWDNAYAHELIQSLEALYPDSSAAHFIRGKWLFHEGRYSEALDHLNIAIAELTGRAQIQAQTLRDLVASTQEVVSDFTTYTSEDGLFEIRYAQRDQVLIPWLAQTLEGAYYNVGYSTGSWPPTPIRVEVYPQSRSLAAVSSLTEEAIETSGTIALCKYNKLMFTSPRATIRGYGWRDTVSHEYVHFAVSHLTGSAVPIWLHEALAKYLEQRWTGNINPHMNPAAEDLLGERVAADNLVTFEQMHPSMAYLPSQEDASTAYAEVFTIMEYMVSRRGRNVIPMLLHTIRENDDIEAAIADVMDEPFEVFKRNWMTYLRARNYESIPGEFQDEIALMPDSADDESPDDYENIPVAARDYLQLGELLRARDMVEASIVEYRNAETLLGSANPVLQNAMARAYLDLNDPEHGLTVLAEVSRWYPNFYRTYLLRGEAFNRLNRFDEAIESLDHAVGINPFDPAVFTELARAYQGNGDSQKASEMREIAANISQ